MSAQFLVVLLIVLVAAVYGGIAIRTWVRLRGRHIVTCPETKRPAGVAVDVGHAMVSAMRERTDVRIATCSRWPERQGCEETCVPQIEASAEGTRVDRIAERYFEGRRCAICGHRIGPLHTGKVPPGFMDPVTREAVPWDCVAAEDLSDAIASRRPLCPDCTLAESSHGPYPLTYRRSRTGSMPRP